MVAIGDFVRSNWPFAMMIAPTKFKVDLRKTLLAHDAATVEVLHQQTGQAAC